MVKFCYEHEKSSDGSLLLVKQKPTFYFIVSFSFPAQFFTWETVPVKTENVVA